MKTQLIMIAIILCLATTAHADNFVLMAGGGGTFTSGGNGLSNSFAASSNGYSVFAGAILGFAPFSISGNAALTTLGGFGDTGISSLTTPTAFYEYLNVPRPDLGIGYMSGPFVTITDAGVPADGQTHSVPAHFTVDIGAVGPTFNTANDSYHFIGDGFLTVTEPFQNRDGSYAWSASVGGSPPVPEPSTWLLLASGLAGLALSRKRVAG